MLAVLLTACKEKGPAIDFSGTQASDTAYVAAVETQQPRNVLIEEATGVRCPNCPAGAALIESFETSNPGRIVAISIHSGNLTEPLEISNRDFRSQAGADMLSFFGGEPNKPAAAFDRIPTSAGAFFNDKRNEWSGAVAGQLAAAAPANLTITSTWNATEKQAVIVVRAAFTKDLQRPVSLSVALTESGIIDPQEDGINIDTFYQHRHILRALLTPASGAQLLNGAGIAAGQVYERTFLYTPDTAWNPAGCELAAFLHYNDQQGKEVLQAAHAPLQ